MPGTAGTNTHSRPPGAHSSWAWRTSATSSRMCSSTFTYTTVSNGAGGARPSSSPLVHWRAVKPWLRPASARRGNRLAAGSMAVTVVAGWRDETAGHGADAGADLEHVAVHGAGERLHDPVEERVGRGQVLQLGLGTELGADVVALLGEVGDASGAELEGHGSLEGYRLDRPGDGQPATSQRWCSGSCSR